MIKAKTPPQTIRVCVHNTAVSRSANNLQRQSVVNHHRKKWNMPSELNGSTIGYNFFCEATGHRTQERYIGEETIAQIGNNWDIPQRGGTISYCMAGDFRVEKPTQMQVDDFKQFLTELEDAGFTVSSVVQHKDLHPGRICAALTEADLQALTQRPPSRESVSQKIARLESELVQSRAMIKQLTGMVTLLIRMFNK